MAVESWAVKEIDALTEFRRGLHQNPELLYDVGRTAHAVAGALRAAGVDEVRMVIQAMPPGQIRPLILFR